MVELIALFILFISLIGIGIIIIRKVPVLAKLSPAEIAGPGVFRRLKNRVKNNGALKSFSGELLLQRTLSKIRILTLKTDNKTSAWLGKLRQRSLKKKKTFSGDYWRKLKKRK